VHVQFETEPQTHPEIEFHAGAELVIRQNDFDEQLPKPGSMTYSDLTVLRLQDGSLDYRFEKRSFRNPPPAQDVTHGDLVTVPTGYRENEFQGIVTEIKVEAGNFRTFESGGFGKAITNLGYASHIDISRPSYEAVPEANFGSAHITVPSDERFNLAMQYLYEHTGFAPILVSFEGEHFTEAEQQEAFKRYQILVSSEATMRLHDMTIHAIALSLLPGKAFDLLEGKSTEDIDLHIGSELVVGITDLAKNEKIDSARYFTRDLAELFYGRAYGLTDEQNQELSEIVSDMVVRWRLLAEIPAEYFDAA
jgi:hypothetical protein